MSFLANKRNRAQVFTNEQKSRDRVYQLILSSLDRINGSTITEPVFAINPPLTGVVSAQIGSFTFFNTVPNLGPTNNVLGFDPNAVYAAVDVTFAAGNWTAPEGLLTVAAFNVDQTLGLNDIRYEIYRQVAVANAGLVTEILVSPVTGRLSLTFDAAAVDVVLTGTTTATAWTGLTGLYGGVSWTADARLCLCIPLSMAIASPEFSNHAVSKGADFKASTWMTVVPLTTSWGSLQYYEPLNPQQFRFTGSQILNNLTLQLRNTENGAVMAGFEAADKWELMLRLTLSDDL